MGSWETTKHAGARARRPELPLPAARLAPPRNRGLERRRLLEVLERAWCHRLTMVTGPPGAGKSTVLAQAAASAEVPVVWYRVGADDASPRALLAHLELAWSTKLPCPVPGWRSPEELVAAADAWNRPAMIVVDDLHLLGSKPAQDVFERIVRWLPASVPVVAAARRPPDIDLAGLRVSDELLEVTADDLRFRSWEVSDLLRRWYGTPLSPDDVTVLTRRTEGWAAGLHLFQLATRGKTGAERRAVLTSLAARGRLFREYLTRNVLDGLSDDVRRFLVRSSVFDQLSGPLCDALLGRTDSAQLLDALSRQQLFVVPTGDGTYRYHSVLASFLRTLLLEEAGDAAARARQLHAGRLLEHSHDIAEALHAYARAQSWDDVRRLFAAHGDRVGSASIWLDGLPSSVTRSDPWLQLADARRHLARGELAKAVAGYAVAEGAFPSWAEADRCRRERRLVQAWLDADAPVPEGWLGVIRHATRGEPVAAMRRAAAIAGPTGRFAEGVAAVLAGHFEAARRLLLEALDEAEGILATCSRAVYAVALLATGDEEGWAELAAAASDADIVGLGTVGELANAIVGPDFPWSRGEGHELVTRCDMRGDAWGAALAALALGVGALRVARASSDADLVAHATNARDALETASSRFDTLGAPTLTAWSCSLAALAAASSGAADADGMAEAAEQLAARAAVPGAHAVARAALERARPPAGGHPSAARAAAESRADVHVVVHHRPPRLRCLGRFALELHGRPVDVAGVKPRPRALLWLLSINEARVVHREELVDALWPTADWHGGLRSLQVAVSALRHVLEPASGAEPMFVVRRGDGYRLELGRDADVDVRRFNEAVAASAEVVRAGDPLEVIAATERVLDVYTGDLVPEVGPAGWVVAERERMRLAAADAAQALAQAQLTAGDPGAAASACETGLRLDRYRDILWRLLITSLEAAGDHAAAALARGRYNAVLAELGLVDA